jgi:hypothetical protein
MGRLIIVIATSVTGFVLSAAFVGAYAGIVVKVAKAII